MTATYPSNYPLYDQWGLTQVPTSTGAVFTAVFDNWGKPILPPVCDPSLAVILDWLGTWLDTDGNISRIWQAISGGARERVLKSVFMHDPSDVDLNSRDLPALYMWRADGKQEWAADDWQRETTKITALWVFPDGPMEKQRIRAPFAQVLAKLIGAGIERGRTPTWQQPGDPDPDATTLGSLFWNFAGFENFGLESWRKTKLTVEMVERDVISRDEYPAIEFTFSMQEKLDYGLGRYESLLGGNLTVNTSNVSPATWSPTTYYPPGFLVVPSPSNGYYYSSGGGWSGPTQPTFGTTVGGTTADGQVLWTNAGQTSVEADNGPLDNENPAPAPSPMQQLRFAITAAGGQSLTFIPAGSVITGVVEVDVSTPFSPGATLQLGSSTSPALIFPAGTVDNALAHVGLDTVFADVPWPTNSVVVATIGGSPTAGAAEIVLQYGPANP